MHRTKQDRQRVALSARLSDREHYSSLMTKLSSAQSAADSLHHAEAHEMYLEGAKRWKRNEREISVLAMRLGVPKP